MTFTDTRTRTRRLARQPRVVMRRRTVAEAAFVVAGLVLSLSIAPAVQAHAEPRMSQPVDDQAVLVEGSGLELDRDGFGATPAQYSLMTSGTNHDWAELVLLSGGWPRSEENIKAITRWMRQENGPDNWFNRNNPLNNGYGSGGGGGLGSYPDLLVAAQKAAENLQRGAGYVDIVAALEDGASADAVARAIWASPWSTSHYHNGTHWSTRPVEVVKAPTSSWPVD
jgi:hypothetical protein